MDHALRVHHDTDAIEPDRKQVMRLDQFEALVEHRRAIDADLGAHVPVRMRNRLFGRDRGKVIPRSQRAATGRERD